MSLPPWCGAQHCESASDCCPSCLGPSCSQSTELTHLSWCHGIGCGPDIIPSLFRNGGIVPNWELEMSLLTCNSWEGTSRNQSGEVDLELEASRDQKPTRPEQSFFVQRSAWPFQVCAPASGLLLERGLQGAPSLPLGGSCVSCFIGHLVKRLALNLISE